MTELLVVDFARNPEAKNVPTFARTWKTKNRSHFRQKVEDAGFRIIRRDWDCGLRTGIEQGEAIWDRPPVPFAHASGYLCVMAELLVVDFARNPGTKNVPAFARA